MVLVKADTMTDQRTTLDEFDAIGLVAVDCGQKTSVVTLTLEVAGTQAAKLGGASRQIFGAEGGTIGRSPQNSFVLPNPRVSGRHAIITCRNGVFYIEDVSRNGVA